MTEKQKRYIYEKVMNSASIIIKKHLNELSTQTIKNASNKIDARNLKLLKKDTNGNYSVNAEALKKYLLNAPRAMKKRYITLYKKKLLPGYLIRQQHVIGTHAQSDLEWFRDNTDISLSPEFFKSTDIENIQDADIEAAWGKDYKFTERKPTKDEHDFYMFYSSLGQDTTGMNPERVKVYKDAINKFYREMFNMDGDVI